MNQLPAAVAVVVALATLPGTAHATTPQTVTGRECSFSSSDDPEGSISAVTWQVGEIDGGPYVATGGSDDTIWPPTTTLICSIQVGGTGHPDEADAATASASGSGVAYLAPTVIQYVASAVDPVWTCTEVVVDGRWTYTRYYLDTTTGTMTTDPAAATCALAVSQPIPPPLLTGRPCAFASADDTIGIQHQPSQTGEIDGGPYVATGDAGDPENVTLTCSIQVGGTGHPGDPDAVTASATGLGAAAVAPTPMRYDTHEPDPVWLCTDVVAGAIHYYYDAPSNSLTTDPATATCLTPTPLAVP